MNEAAATATVRITLQFPPGELSPNARLQWYKRDPFRADYRNSAKVGARQWRNTHAGYGPLRTPVKMHLIFIAPNRQRRDVDNLVARMKPAFDGLVDARLLVEDHSEVLQLASVFCRAAEPGEEACVHIDLEEAPL